MENLLIGVIVVLLVLIFLVLLLNDMRVKQMRLKWLSFVPLPVGMLSVVNKAKEQSKKEGYTAAVPTNLVPDPIMESIAKGGNSIADISPAKTNDDLPWSNGMFNGYEDGIPYMNVMSYADQFITFNGSSPNGNTIVTTGKKCCPRWTANACVSSPYGECGCPKRINIDDPQSTAIANSLQDVRAL